MPKYLSPILPQSLKGTLSKYLLDAVIHLPFMQNNSHVLNAKFNWERDLTLEILLMFKVVQLFYQIFYRNVLKGLLPYFNIAWETAMVTVKETQCLYNFWCLCADTSVQWQDLRLFTIMDILLSLLSIGHSFKSHGFANRPLKKFHGRILPLP